MDFLKHAELAEQATAADDFRIISEAALAVFGWTDERYKRVLRLLDVGASLDAAMTLVPEGCLFHVRTLWDGPKTWGYAHIHTYGEDAEECDGKRHLDDYVGSAATLALALCAAALRTRPTTTGESGL